MRQRERALAKRGEAVLKSGLPQRPDKDDVVAVAYAVARMFRETGREGRASRAAEAVLAMCETSRKRAPGVATLACQKGCAYCCHGWVGASVPEILLIARGIRSQTGSAAARTTGIVMASDALAGLGPAERFGRRLACPLLQGGLCSQYRERPITCRQVTSLDLSKCVEEFEGIGAGDDVPVSAVHLAHARNAHVPLIAALQISGLDAATYELSGALVRVLGIEDAEERWLGGEDVLVGAQRGPPHAAAVVQAVEAIRRELTGLGERYD
jgi:hypothetical protein